MEKNFTFQNVSVNYQVTGTGRPVVLQHGFGEDRTIWNSQVNFLHSFCKLIVPDLPGTGKSGLLPNENATLENYADCIYELLRHEQIPKVTMLGHSMGGYITLAFAEKYPDLLDGFGLIHSTAFADNEEKKEARKKGIDMVKKYGSYPFLKNSIPNLFSDNFKKNNPAVVQQQIEAGKNFSSEAVIQYYTAMMNRPDRTHVLKNAAVPVLFILGEEDVAAPLEDLKKQIDLPSQVEVHILKNTGHMGMLEATDEMNQYMLQFITR